MTSYSLLLAAALVAGPAEADDLREAGRLLDRGRATDAEGLLLRVTRAQRRSGAAHRLLGHAYRQQHRYSRACREYEEALRINPADGEAREGLASARRRRGPGLFAALGEWEGDSSNTKGWQGELYYGGIDRVEAYAGLSYSDKFFYTRRKAYAKAHRFFSPSGYVAVNLSSMTYDFPVEVTPIPDSNSYRDLPRLDVEVAGELRPRLRGSVAYQYSRPNFFHAPASHASTHKFSGELSWQTAWSPLRLRGLAAVLRDPDPAGTVIDRSRRELVALRYGWHTLLGAGAEVDLGRASGVLLFIPNPDLDHSQAYSVVTGLAGRLHGPLAGRADYIYSRYSDQSVFAGQKSHVATATLRWRYSSAVELSAGFKVARRPIRSDSGPFLTVQVRP
jgi:tetratricopeptide (TPR) repeat protein